jgi:hypothetical protein
MFLQRFPTPQALAQAGKAPNFPDAIAINYRAFSHIGGQT